MDQRGLRRAQVWLISLFAGLWFSLTPWLASSQTGAGKAEVEAAVGRIRAGILAGTSRPEEAIQELKAILAVDPELADAHVLLGIAYRTLGSADFLGEAVAELRQALELDPSHLPARLYLAHIYIDLGRYERAREEIGAALVRVPAHPQFLTLLGDVERRLGNPKRAKEVLEEALLADAYIMQARYYLALALLDLKRPDEAIAHLDLVVKSGEKRADVYLSLGIAHLDWGRVDKGLEALVEATHVDPARRDVRIQLARAYRLQGLLDDAESQLALGVPQAVSSTASPFLQQRDLEFDLYLEQGLLRLAQGRLDAARDAFRKVLEMDPDHGPTNRHLAGVYLRQAEYALSVDYANRAEKLGFPLPPAERKLLDDGLAKRAKSPGTQQ
jgi:tetratricopeptide (TPR) repeat protein